MFLIDSLLIGSLRFVLDKLARAVDAELNDDGALRERLLEAQMRLEMGELSEEEFVQIERDVLDRIREIRRAREGEGEGTQEFKVTGVEATFGGDDDER